MSAETGAAGFLLAIGFGYFQVEMDEPFGSVSRPAIVYDGRCYPKPALALFVTKNKTAS